MLPMFWRDEVLCGQDGVEGWEWLRGTEIMEALREQAGQGHTLVSSSGISVTGF